MIHEALLHCAGIGPARLARLHARGVRSWFDVMQAERRIPAGVRQAVLDESRRCLAALERGDVAYFVDRLAPADRWRILAQFLPRASFFDIETTGLELDDTITVIACWHRGALHTFVEHENLDGFLELLDDVELLVSFNGSAFDVPRVLDGFHIPRLPCPHLDLRWTCYHRGLTGNLKSIARRLGCTRPGDLADSDGALAVALWHAWTARRDGAARARLIRYCAADVLLSVMVAHHVAGHDATRLGELWSRLPPAGEPGEGKTPATAVPEALPGGPGVDFGPAAPRRLRARRRRAGRPRAGRPRVA